ncbi:Stk1 family PASTA domain-containing Ser/Thr kinase [Frondihabitans australicus]|uniref:non-specific serine/threonine protein kinase n=1 Tax=Frondihabitans australicus TaxID=386892 RepID=A0A495IF94_9MICO|nr:Stk1 family PASTA domain-containing Ser/Thr kinase [Frondihabitans australicus]RKR74320.1 serine/threonine-protein kinase [Frondihabitans australicus]
MSVNQTDPMIGRLIDGRYQVRSRIARGGMATVYLASDLRLERPVAVKIMHGHLADDENFKERFIQEARSAARLAHPNVVNVFDQGQDDESAYLVMEYLPGITLRELLQDHRVLTPEQATDILEAVLAGLAAAHRSGIVHRDLKPENVLLADDGRIKIGDFGLARAASANTATGAALLGTIAYLSPELVTRGVADTRSDIYALGIMLYEMLTGEQPYKGDQPMQIAYQHANDTVPMPSAVNPRVPPELDELVLWATARDPDQRPRDARAMLDHLFELQRGGATGGVQKTMVLPSAMAPVPPLQRTTGPTGPVPPSGTGETFGGSTGDTQILPKGRHRTGPVVPALSENAEALQKKAGRRRRRGAVWLVIVIVVALVALGTALWFNVGPGAMASVPGVSRSSVSQATSTLTADGFAVSKTQEQRYSTSVPAGEVTGTRPRAGATVHKGATVTLIVSQGPRILSFPQVTGHLEATARAALKNFTVKASSYQFSNQAKNVVLSVAGTTSAGADEDLGSASTYREKGPVTLTVSLGPVPDVTGKTVSDAQATLSAVGLVGDQTASSYSDTVAAGSVISQAQANQGTVIKGDHIDLTVSKGPAPITLPDETGKKVSTAEAALKALGLKVTYADCTTVQCSTASALGFDWRKLVKVQSQSPAGKSTVHKGDTITLTYDGSAISVG